ncbi:MAG: isochorismatase family protein, partial [Micrococcales bacterium]
SVAVKVKESFVAAGHPVITVQHIATKPNSTFFLPGTTGAEVHESLTPSEREQLIVKHFPNSFRETNLLELLNSLEVTDLTVVGMMTHMCIDTTVRAASDLGFKVELIEDACATRNLTHAGLTVSAAEVQAAYLAALDGSFATVRRWADK